MNEFFIPALDHCETAGYDLYLWHGSSLFRFYRRGQYSVSVNDDPVVFVEDLTVPSTDEKWLYTFPFDKIVSLKIRHRISIGLRA